jgi:hypothetical protein
MGVIDRWNFAKVQSAIETTFTGSAQVMRRIQTSDASGGFVVSYTLVHTYPCSYSRYPVRPLDRELQPRVQVVTAYRFLFAEDADIQAIDRLLVGDRVFEVIECDVANLPTYRDAFCQEIL